MENRPSYQSRVSIRPDCLMAASAWTCPQPEEVKCALSMAGWSDSQAASILGLPKETVQAWLDGRLAIPYAAWCLLSIEAGLGEIWK
jgi:DNA-binding transcriptional regulator YiaG